MNEKFPVWINIFATNRCNQNCKMCVNSEYRGRNASAGDISAYLIARIMPELARYKPGVCITGGEPLINRDIFSIIRLLTGENLNVYINSNGLLLEKYASEIASSGLGLIILSLDHYLAEYHDASRGVRGAYDKISRGIKALNVVRDKDKLKIQVNSVITRKTIGMLGDMYSFIESLDVDLWSLGHFLFLNPGALERIARFQKGTGSGAYVNGFPIHEKGYLDDEQIEILDHEIQMLKLKSRYSRTNFSIGPEMDDIKAFYRGEEPLKSSTCVVPGSYVNIMPGNIVTQCTGDTIGDLDLDPSIERAWNSKAARDFRALFSREKVLPTCFRCCSLNYRFKE
jgi:MoaA/NifB/PqqE/SkfB family radical SAM enzyme